MSEPLTRSLGAFVSGLQLEGIPSEALGVVHTGFADCVGTMIAGRRCTSVTPAGRKIGAEAAVPVVRTIALRLSAAVAQSPSGPASSMRNQASLPSHAMPKSSTTAHALPETAAR